MIFENRNDTVDKAYYFYPFYHKYGNISLYKMDSPIQAKKKNMIYNMDERAHKVLVSYI